ncbi:hypothetical protein K439DRAFT_1352038, partial [Ramaria rubella]
AHGAHVESTDFDPLHRRLATVGNGEAKIWNVNIDWTMTLYHSEESRALIARSVHFFNKGRSVMVTYLESHRM